MYLQPQCQSHRSISNWVRKSLHHLRSPDRTKITRQHHSFKKVWRYLKEMATSWVCWLISNALGTSSSLLGEKLEGNLRVMFKVKKKEKKKNHTTVLIFKRSSGLVHSLPFLLSQISVTGHSLLSSLSGPIPSNSQARTVYVPDRCPGRGLMDHCKEARIS